MARRRSYRESRKSPFKHINLNKYDCHYLFMLTEILTLEEVKIFPMKKEIFIINRNESYPYIVVGRFDGHDNISFGNPNNAYFQKPTIINPWDLLNKESSLEELYNHLKENGKLINFIGLVIDPFPEHNLISIYKVE